MKAKIKVLGIIRDNGACSFYRIKQPLAKVNEQGFADVALFGEGNRKNSEDELYGLLKEADVIMIPRVIGKEWIEFIKEWQSEGKKIIIDHDDDIFNVSPMSQHYIDSGTKEVQIKDEDGNDVFLWKHGLEKNGKVFDVEKNIEKMEAAKECMRLADALTVTTNELGMAFEEYNKNIFVLPNCLDLEIWNQPEMVKNGNIRIGWQGGSSHYRDWLTVKEPLKKVINKHDNVTLVLAGHMFAGIYKEIDEEQIEYHKWVPTDAHPYKQALLNTDIAIIPLQDNRFNRCKSALKYAEYSALKIPSVVAGIPPYSPVVNDGIDGLLFNNESEFIEKLEYLIDSVEARKRVGNAAYEGIKENFDADAQAYKWADVFRYLCGINKKHIVSV